MNLSAPTRVVFIIALVLGILGLLGTFHVLSFPYIGYALPSGFILLVISVLVPGI